MAQFAIVPEGHRKLAGNHRNLPVKGDPLRRGAGTCTPTDSIVPCMSNLLIGLAAKAVGKNEGAARDATHAAVRSAAAFVPGRSPHGLAASRSVRRRPPLLQTRTVEWARLDAPGGARICKYESEQHHHHLRRPRPCQGHTPTQPPRRGHALDNDAAGHRQLLRLVRKAEAKSGAKIHVVPEAAGGYEKAVVQALHAASIALSVLPPSRVRAFAHAQGQLAKTDPVRCRGARRLWRGHPARAGHAAHRRATAASRSCSALRPFQPTRLEVGGVQTAAGSAATSG